MVLDDSRVWLARVFLAHAFRARPLGLPAAVLQRAWYVSWASGAVVVLMACFGLAAQGLLAEPLVDLAVALYALCFSVMIVEASAATKHRRVKSSVPRRVAGAIPIIGFSFGLALIIAPALGLFRTGLLAVAVAAVVPLFPTIHRALFGIDRRPRASVLSTDADVLEHNAMVEPVPMNTEQREAVYAVLLGAQPDSELDLNVLGHWLRCLSMLKALRPPPLPNAPTKHPLQHLLFTCDDGLEKTKWRVSEEMAVLLESLFEGDLDEQKHALVDLMRRSAVSLGETSLDWIGRKREPPSAMEMLEAECIARLPHLPDPAGERRRWTRIRAMRRAWLTGKVAGWTGAMQPVEVTHEKGRVTKDKSSARTRLLVRACSAVLGWWLANLEAAVLRAAGSDGETALTSDRP